MSHVKSGSDQSSPNMNLSATRVLVCEMLKQGLYEIKMISQW